jgi:hypothetical protein
MRLTSVASVKANAAGAAGKAPVFGILEREGLVKVQA